MGREIKRVPLGFDHPIGQVWDGYVNPHYKQCPVCDGRGVTNARRRLDELVSLILLSGTDGLDGKNHPYFSRNQWLFSNIQVSSDMAELTTGLAGRSPNKFSGHDALDRWRATKAVIEAAGLDPDTWGICPVCKGDGIDPEHLEAYDAWQESDPPEGDGWQLWETVSEGSPVSPVFDTREALITWMITNGYDPRMVNLFLAEGDWMPSAIMNGEQNDD